MTTSGVSCPQRIDRGLAFSQIDRDVDAGIRSGTERDDRRPGRRAAGTRKRPSWPAGAGDDHPLAGQPRLVDSSIAAPRPARQTTSTREWSPSSRRIACGRSGERSTTTSRPIKESAMRRSTLRMMLPLQHDRVLDLAAGQLAIGTDRRERADVGVAH